MKNTPKNIYDQLTDDKKALLGFNCVPPKDEFSRLRRISQVPEIPENYNLPK